jgi:Spy/CpxP family protein refolding chaperone
MCGLCQFLAATTDIREGEIAMSRKKALLMGVVLLAGLSALAQAPADASAQAPSDANGGWRPVTDDDIAVLRQDVQASKTDIITRSMGFTEEQSKAFWPVYREYANEQQKIGDDRVSLIKDYAANYDKIDDAQAQSYLTRALRYEDDIAKLRKTYVPRFEKAIGPKQTAKFYQVDNRLSLLVNLQLANLLPIIK